MYQFLQTLTPDQVYAISLQLYRELLASGYTAVGEFHYVHNDADGNRYAQLSEMAFAVIHAAVDAGLRICFLPALFQKGGFGEPIQPNQRRFYLESESMRELIHQVVSEFRAQPLFSMGIALHSLRAVDLPSGQAMIADFSQQFPGSPIHIHIAEQTAEVQQCVAATGQRPIEFLFNHFPVDSRWCLVHATHAETDEIDMMADCGCVVGLCPMTEANLGDGIFPAEQFLQQGGRFGIGSDSQVSTFWTSELRMLEYGQRLRHRRRSILSTDQHSTGRILFDRAASGGAQALGLNAGRLAPGQLADLIVVDPQHPTLGNVSGDRILDRLIFCDQGNPVQKVMINGQWGRLG